MRRVMDGPRQGFAPSHPSHKNKSVARVGHPRRFGVGGFPGLRIETWGTQLALACLLALAGCHGAQRDPRTVVFLIESSPANLDPRFGTDAQSQRIDALLFDGLVARNASFQFTPALAESWEQPNPLTLVFHLRGGVRFHDGRALTARDVAWTIESMIDPMLPGGVISPRASSFAAVDNVEARDE